jgi:hypothetical protein
MAKRKKLNVTDERLVERCIYLVNGQRVMFDFDLAILYGVQTKQLNQAVLRNPERFPRDFAFQLSAEEISLLRSQGVIPNSQHGGRRKLPWVFTEHGVAMLSSVLHSEQAIAVNIAIIRTFTRLRRLLATPGELIAQLNQLAETVQLHDEQIKSIIDVLQKMIETPPAPTKPRIGFHTNE